MREEFLPHPDPVQPVRVVNAVVHEAGEIRALHGASFRFAVGQRRFLHTAIRQTHAQYGPIWMHVIWVWQWGQVNMRIPPYGDMGEDVGGREAPASSRVRSSGRRRFGPRCGARRLRSLRSSWFFRRAPVRTLRLIAIPARFA